MNNFQSILSGIVHANKYDVEYTPDANIDPKMVEYAKKLRQLERDNFNSKNVHDTIHHHLNSITQISERTFVYTDNNKPIIRALMYYFTADSEFIDYSIKRPEIFINKTSLKKGLLLIGGYGVGKSTIINAFQRVKFPDRKFKCKTCPSLAENWDYSDRQYFIDNWFFDEFGHEAESKYAKKDALPVMAKILEQRYNLRHFHQNSSTGFTILSTNLSMDEITEKYGNRLADRIHDMFNIILVHGESFRK